MKQLAYTSKTRPHFGGRLCRFVPWGVGRLVLQSQKPLSSFVPRRSVNHQRSVIFLEYRESQVPESQKGGPIPKGGGGSGKWDSYPLDLPRRQLVFDNAHTTRGIGSTFLGQMPETTPYLRTLRRALTICGSIPALASALDSTIGDVSHWLDGYADPPPPVYILALDIVASGFDRGR